MTPYLCSLSHAFFQPFLRGPDAGFRVVRPLFARSSTYTPCFFCDPLPILPAFCLTLYLYSLLDTLTCYLYSLSQTVPLPILPANLYLCSLLFAPTLYLYSLPSP